MEVWGYVITPGFFAILVFIFSYQHFAKKEASLLVAVLESMLSAAGTFVVFLVVIILRETILKR